jgi:predicted AAA+ superfamily ATPase
MIDRFFQNKLTEMLAVFPVVAVVGPRQVGKTTLVTSDKIDAGRSYISLDDIGERSLAQGDPKAFLDRALPVTVDEVQLAPELLREIKLRIDRHRQPGQYLLTGSADLDHCAQISEVLAGRVGILRLPPICRSEETGTTAWKTWLECRTTGDLDAAFSGSRCESFDFGRLLRGGFPPSLLASTPAERSMWMESFRMTYLERDLRRVSDIGNLADFNRLMQLSAAATASLLNQASMARDAGMSPATAGRHLSVLEASLLIERIPPFFANIGKRIVKSPKLYWTDTGLCSHLLCIAETRDFESDPLLRGKLFETFVMMEIRALLPLVQSPGRLHHVRTHDGLEVDGLIESGRQKLLFEVKSAQTVTASDAKPIERWIEWNPTHGPGVVLYAGSTYQPLSKNVRAIPATLLFG